jgi:hypothetical protein
VDQCCIDIVDAGAQAKKVIGRHVARLAREDRERKIGDQCLAPQTPRHY